VSTGVLELSREVYQQAGGGNYLEVAGGKESLKVIW
jgi:hypothetical protein